MKVNFLLFLTLCAYSAGLAQQQGTHLPKSSPSGVYYWEYLPYGYDAAGSTKYPLMIFLHGCGEIAYREGSDCPPQTIITSTPIKELQKVLRNGPPKLINQGSTMCYTVDGVQQCFIVISPQLGNGMSGTSWDARKLDAFIEEVKVLYPAADQKSIYLTGLSLGGIGTWRYAERHPDKLAAYVPISGNSGGDPASLACNLSNIPVWAFHDDPDPLVATTGTTAMENRIKACANHLVPHVTLIENYQIDPNTGVVTEKPVHGAWGTAYSSNPSPANTTTRIIVERPAPVPDGATVYSWMLSHHRTALGPLVNVAPDKTVTTATTTVTATVSHPEAGATITSYLWELVSTETNPPTLTNQTTPTVSISNLKNEHGSCTFRLTVTDNQGYKDTDEIIIKVQIPATNTAPTANAGPDLNITLPQNSVTITGAGTDSDGTIASYAWTQVSGPAAATLSGANTQTLAAGDLTQGAYIFRLTVTDNGAATGFDDVVVDVAAAPPSGMISWNSYNVVTQATPTQQGVVTGTDNSTQATLEFYQSTNIDGVAKGTLFTDFNPGAHPQTGSNLSAYWANGTGNKYPHAGKSTVARGTDTGETNAPLPNGVYDLQLHPPSTDYLGVAAFIVPLSGEYTLSNVAVRRVSNSGANVRLKVFNPTQTLILDLLATNNRAWVQSPNTLYLGTLTAGDRIYFGIDREDTYATDFAEVAWTLTWIPPNTPPTVDAGSDVSLTLPQSSTSLNGSASDADGTVATYSWTQVSGPAAATLTDADKNNVTVSDLVEGSYIFRLTAADDDGATAFDDVIVTVLPAPTIISWNSYDIVTQETATQQGVVTSTDNTTQATVEFYQSTNIDGVAKGTLFTTFNPGAHPQTGSNLSAYWANGTGNKYPHAGKSTVARGTDTGETNAPMPNGVYDLQLHPPSTDYLGVAAFIVPLSGEYTLSNVAVRRVSNSGASVRLKVFNPTQTLILDLLATNNRAWVQSPNTLYLGTLTAGDRIYFGIDREDTYATDFAEVAWTVNLTPAVNSAARSKPAQSVSQNENIESIARNEEPVLFYPNPVKNTIYLEGLTGETDVRIFNMIGTLVQQNKVDQNAASLTLQSGSLPPGFYTMILESQRARRYFRFLKE